MSKLTLNRRQFLVTSGAATTASALGFPTLLRAQSKGEMTFFSYTTYTDRRLTGEFPNRSGITLRLQNFGNLDQMVGKLKATGGSGVDVVSVANNLTRQLYEDGLLEPIDVSRLKHWKDVFPEFQNADFIQTGDPGTVIGLPTVWGPEGLLYRTDKVDSADSWTDLWDSRYKGRIGAVDYGYEMVLIAAQVLGYQENLLKSPIDFTDEQYAAIKAKLIEQKQYITKYWGSSAEAASLVASGEIWISVGRLSMLKPAREEGVPVRMVAPKEGAQGWCTSSCIVRDSKNKEQAYAFLDYLTGEIYQNGLANVKGYPIANKALLMALPESQRNELMLNDPNLLSSMVWWKQAADTQRINTLWNEVKAA